MNKILITIILLVFASSVINMSFPTARFFILAFSLLLICFFLFKKKQKNKINRDIVLSFTLYTFFSLFSAIINADWGLFFGTVSLLFLFTSLSIAYNSLVRQQQLKIISYGIIYSHTAILITSIILFGGFATPFKGIFENPNSMSQLLVTLLVPFIAIFSQRINDSILLDKKNKKTTTFFLLVIIIYLFYLIMLTNSRTGTLIAIIMFCLPIGCIGLKSMSKVRRLLGKLTVWLPILATVVWLALYITNLGEIIYETIDRHIIYKFRFRSDGGDLTSGRSEVWNTAIENAEVFGNGKDAFVDGVGAHNTFIGILGSYGWVPLVFFLIFIVIILFRSILYWKSSKEFVFLPLLMMFAFILGSLTEGLMYKPLMIGIFLISGMDFKGQDIESGSFQSKRERNRGISFPVVLLTKQKCDHN